MKLLRVGLVLISVISAREVGAQAYEGARLLSLAEAQRALANANDAIYVNPAGLALSRMYSLEAGYVDDLRGSDRRFNASVMDSQAGPVAGGLAYTYSKRRPDLVPQGDARLEGHRVELALATLLAQSLALGVTTRYLTFERKSGEEEQPEENFKTLTIDAGLQWRPTPGLALGFVGYNLTKNERPEIPIGWGAGIGYQLEAFMIEADVRYNAQRGAPLFAGGAGYVFGGLVPVRAGVAYDRESKAVTLSLGAGLNIERFGIDVAYRQRLNTEGDAEDRDERVAAVSMRLLVF